MSDDAEEEAAQETLAAVRALLTEVVQTRQRMEEYFRDLKAELDAIDGRLVDALQRRPKLN